MPLSTDQRWETFRLQMPVTSRRAVFDHAAVAPLPAAARDAIAQWLTEATEEGGSAWARWERRMQEARTTAAAMVGAEPEEIGLIRSTTEGITMVAEGFPWREGENVVLPADEFPSNQYPWLNLESRGVEVRRVPVEGGRLDLNRLEAACDGRTRIVSLSWVGFLSGWRTDLNAAAEMAHRRGALLLVDAIQAVGAFPLDVRQTPIDFFAADGHKWMLGPEGAGLLFIRREHLARLRPLGVGWSSMVHGDDFTHIEYRLKTSADRYEGGSPNSAGFAGLGASLKLLTGLGIDNIGRRVLEITDECCRRLQELGAVFFTSRDRPEHSSGIVTFEFPGHDSLALKRHCSTKQVWLSQRSGKLRISPHAYANDGDIGRLIDALAEGKQVCRSK
jgi:selenocysteine lyase/cysteine desulfurase